MRFSFQLFRLQPLVNRLFQGQRCRSGAQVLAKVSEQLESACALYKVRDVALGVNPLERQRIAVSVVEAEIGRDCALVAGSRRLFLHDSVVIAVWVTEQFNSVSKLRLESGSRLSQLVSNLFPGCSGQYRVSHS